MGARPRPDMRLCSPHATNQLYSFEITFEITFTTSLLNYPISASNPETAPEWCLHKIQHHCCRPPHTFYASLESSSPVPACCRTFVPGRLPFLFYSACVDQCRLGRRRRPAFQPSRKGSPKSSRCEVPLLAPSADWLFQLLSGLFFLIGKGRFPCKPLFPLQTKG
jgi:hypothetical protein